MKLAPGQTAAADIQFVNVHNHDAAGCRPTSVRGLDTGKPPSGTTPVGHDMNGQQFPGATIVARATG
ncbi:DUF4232 domain-containing protein [Amycolatopsis mediterranei]|uniref:DUF4232 domain-containing protein n=1 Tax=Amycolatopsis mediterranei TaxID=33910 RepID=UPI0036109248